MGEDSAIEVPEWPCHIIGNGPSKSLWLENMDQHLGEMSIGSNLEERCRLTTIYDRKVLAEVAGSKRKIRRPVVVVGNAAEELMNNRDAFRKMVVVGIVFKRPLRIFCAGHGAILWASRCGYGPIHCWGFDSLWDGLRQTDSDQFWPRSPKLNKAPQAWRKSWGLLFDRYTDLRLKVHLPKGEKIRMKELNRHFQMVHHEIKA